MEYINLDIEKYIYRAEGNVNLVLSINNTGNILRLRKFNLANAIELTDEEVRSELLNHLLYIQHLSSIIDINPSDRPKLAMIKVADLNNMNSSLKRHRPVNRLKKEILTRYGLLFRDAAFLPANISAQKVNLNATFAVEIKPKQGWSLCEANSVKCRFCSLQYLKFKDGSISDISEYCPFDLFSGNRTRMYKALQALIKTPQNNFRIFKNGCLSFSEGFSESQFNNLLNDIFVNEKIGSSMKPIIFINILISVLCDNHKCSKKYFNSNQIKIPCLEDQSTQLPINSPLRRIYDVQLLAKNNYNAKMPLNDSSSYSYIESLTKKALNDLSSYEKYMLGATALDCSIMVTFKVIQKDEIKRLDDICKKHIFSVCGTNILAITKIMDLDPKISSHHLKYKTKSLAAIEAYRNTIH